MPTHSFPPTQWLSETEFWANEYDPLRPEPDRLGDLVIYEMHVGGLGFGKRDVRDNPLPGSFEDAVALLDHLVELGVNAIELMPMSEAEGWSWGYATSHYFAIEYSGAVAISSSTSCANATGAASRCCSTFAFHR